MRTRLNILLAALSFISIQVAGQFVQPHRYAHNSFTGQVNIGVGTVRVTAPSAYLEIGPSGAQNKGMLPPRLTTTQRDAIASPATWLTIINTTTGRWNFYNGSSWVEPAVDTANKWVRWIEKNGANDSLVFYIGSVRYAVSNPAGTGGGGITELGDGFGLIKVDDSTYRVDTNLISTRLWRQKGIDSVVTLLAAKLNIADSSAMLTNYLNLVGYGLLRTGQIARLDSATVANYFLRRKDSLTATNLLGYVTRTILADTAAAIRASTGAGTYTDEQAQDAVGTIMDNIEFTYTDGTPSIVIGAIAQSKITNLVTDLANKQPLDADLTAISGLSPTNDDLLQYKAGAWANRTIAQVKTDFGITTVGNNILTLPNPSAVRYIQINADNTITVQTAAAHRAAIGAGTGDGTITALTGDVTASGSGSVAATIANDAVTLAKMANMATSSLIYRKTLGTGDPEVNTLATLKFDLGLSGTNTGDQPYPGVGIAVSNGSAWGTSITDNSTNWNTAYTDRLKWDGGATGLVAATGRTSLGFTTWSGDMIQIANPSAIRYIKINADNTVTLRTAAEMLADIGAQAALVSATNIKTVFGATLLGAGDAGIVPKAYGGTGEDNSTGGTANHFWARPNGSAGAASYRAIVAADIPTLNQNTTGQAGSVANALSIGAEISPIGATSYNGSAARTIGIQSLSVVNSMIANSTIDLTTKVTGVLPVANGGSGQSTYTNGQILIGNTTGNTLTKATLTQGVFQSITNGAGSITIGIDSSTLFTNAAGALRRKDSLTAGNLLGYVTRKVLADTAAAVLARVGKCLTVYDEMVVGQLGDPAHGDTSVTHTSYINKQMEVHRSGELLIANDTISGYGYLYYPAAGRIRFYPPLYAGEKVDIKAICNDTTYYDNLSIRLSVTEDSNAILYAQAVGATGSTRIAINNYVKALKVYGIWDNIHAMYMPFGSGTTPYRYNLKDPRANDSAYYMTWPNGVTHTSSGLDFNGTDQYGVSTYEEVGYRPHFMVYHNQSGSDTTFIADKGPSALTSLGAQFSFGVVNGTGKITAGNWEVVHERTGMASAGFAYAHRIDTTYSFFDSGGYIGTSAPVYDPLRDRSLAGGLKMMLNAQKFNVGQNDAGISIAAWGNAMDSTKVIRYKEATQAFLSELGVQQGPFGNYPTVTSNPAQYYNRYRWVKGDSLVYGTMAHNFKDGVSSDQFGDTLWTWMGWNPYQSGQTTDSATWSVGNLTTFTMSGPTGIQRRHSYGYARLNNKGYIIGGDAIVADQRDVWETTDGRHWTQKTSNWGMGQRILFGACAHGTNPSDSALYVAGGHDVLPVSGSNYKDVWKSTNQGATWTQIATGINGVYGNISGHMVSYRGKIRVVSGGVYSSTNRKFMYSSTDGVTWDSSAVPFMPLQYSRVIVWDDRLWFIGGTDQGNRRSIWFMDSDENWHELSPTWPSDAASFPTHATAAAVFNDQLVIVSGNESNRCWIIKRIKSTE